MGENNSVNVLFVCMGNICRSPTAEGVFERQVRDRRLSERINIDSAGTTAFHAGDLPDRRSMEIALERGIDLSNQRSRLVVPRDFEHFDFLLAMDLDNLSILQSACPAQFKSKVSLLLSFAPHLGIESVPDPYYGGPRGFDDVFDMIEAACMGLLDHIRKEHLSGA